MVRDYFCAENTPDEEMYLPLICGAMRSVARLCVIPVQDIFGYGNEARINTPSTTGDNWKWRLVPGQLSEEVSDQVAEMTKRYGRWRG